MEVFNDNHGVASTFNRRERKPLLKRHSVASCLKQAKPARVIPPLKRRVSFSRNNSVHLIRKENRWQSPEQLINASDIELEHRDENGELDFIEVPDDDNEFSEGPDTCEILNETMAIDATMDFSAKFLVLAERDNEEDNTSNLSQLIEMDESLTLPSSYMDAQKGAPSPDEGETAQDDDTSEVTFLGGKFSDKVGSPAPMSFTELDDGDDQTMELDMTEDLLGQSDGECDSPDQTDEITASMVLDDEFSQHFGMIQAPSGTGSIAALIAADQSDEESERSLEETVNLADLEAAEAQEDDEKTENFLLDNSGTLAPGQNTSEILCFAPVEASTSAHLRATPARTPLNLHRAPVAEPFRGVMSSAKKPVSAGPMTVEDFLSSVHISFRIFDTRKHSTCTPLPPAAQWQALQQEIPKTEMIVGKLSQELLLRSRIGALQERDALVETQINDAKGRIADAEDELSQRNPACFRSSLLCRKQLTSIRQRTQDHAKLTWHNDRLEMQRERRSDLMALSASLDEVMQQLNHQLLNMQFPEVQESFLETSAAPTKPSVAEATEKAMEEQAGQLADVYDILCGLPDWSLVHSEGGMLQFEFNNEYRLTIECSPDGSVTPSLATVASGQKKSSSVKKSLVASLQCNEILRSLHTLKDLPVVLERLAFWMGRAEDIVEELNRIEASSPLIHVHLDTIQDRETAKKLRTRIEVTWSGDSSSLPMPAGFSQVTFAVELATRSFPETLHWSVKDILNEQDNDALLQALRDTTERFPASQFPYGRLEKIFLALRH